MRPLTIKVWVLHLTPKTQIVASTQKIINQQFIWSFFDNSEISINMKQTKTNRNIWNTETSASLLQQGHSALT